MRDKPGSLQSRNSKPDEEEDWETGIETSYSVKSVTYTAENEAVFVTPKESMDHEARRAPTSPHEVFQIPKDESQYSKPMMVGTPPLEDDDSYYDDHSDYDDLDFDGWDLGSHRKKVHKTTDTPMDVKEKESDLERLTRKNPSVSLSWLANLSNKEKGNTEADNRVKTAAKEPMWMDVQLFNEETMKEAKLWHHRLAGVWTAAGSKMTHDVSIEFKHCFDALTNPYAVALYLIESASDYPSGE